ncbi:NAD(P)H-quinone oxidoreductase subunit F [Myxosarcina sp. GI1]|uniref:NAD(P)H-quinone oxidoreductase subunit F n=1 Tax=Myxosarcina sp. GI1 TaxID=1541065 RepID=UPI000561E12B|nr:NAD(P)H-quinone oxidoreductase subunit F [Myxosarcina sp. GI1]
MEQIFSESIWLVPCYALIGATLALMWSPGIIKKTGSRPAGYLNIAMTCVAFVHSVFALQEVWQQPVQEIRFPWLTAAGLYISFDIKISAVTVGALVLITGLNILAQIYAIGYMEMDWGWARFYALMSFFEAGLCGLALCNSLFFSYVFLELLTLATYLIVGFWFAQPLVVTGARDAFWTKRVGDLLLLIGIIALWSFTGTWNYDELAQWTEVANLKPITANLLCLALIAGPLAKCAQFPLQLWLDEAMEGPIPASMLRNSIVVATGAYVLIQLQPVLAQSDISNLFMLVIGSATAIGGSLIAIAQVDIKRTLSYSVSAYMGFVFIAVAIGANDAALLLILTHAVAMTLLYMSTGTIVISNITQNITLLGGVFSRRPLSGIAFLVGGAGLIAIPPFGGFWALLDLGNYLLEVEPILLGVMLVVDALTAFNLMRTFCLVFAGKPKAMTKRSAEVLWAMVVPMMILVGVSLHLPLIMQQFNLLPTWAKLDKSIALLLLGSSLLGISLAAILYLKDRKTKPVELVPTWIQQLLANDLYIQDIYRLTIVGLVSIVSRIISWCDRYIVDGVINSIGFGTLFSGQTLRYSNSGQSQFYFLSIVLGTILLGLMLALTFDVGFDFSKINFNTI